MSHKLYTFLQSAVMEKNDTVSRSSFFMVTFCVLSLNTFKLLNTFLADWDATANLMGD